MKRFKNFSSGLITFLIVYFIFFTMNDLVAQLIFYFGLTIVGKYIFRLTKAIINKLTGDSDEQRRNFKDVAIQEIGEERLKKYLRSR